MPPAFHGPKPMVCPHCGAETAVRAKRCSSCHGALRTAAPTAAGTLTPPPPLSGSGGDQETRLGTAPPAVLAGGPERPLEPGSAFGTRYRILRLLGTPAASIDHGYASG